MKNLNCGWRLVLIGALAMFAVSLAYLALKPENQLVGSERSFVNN